MKRFKARIIKSLHLFIYELAQFNPDQDSRAWFNQEFNHPDDVEDTDRMSCISAMLKWIEDNT
jgi:hypothetical protein